MLVLLDELNIVGFKIVLFVFENLKKGKVIIIGLVILSDYEIGEILFILDGGFFIKVRIGVILGVVIKYLVKENVKIFSVIGVGV